MKVLLFTGGSGSTELQKGLNYNFNFENESLIDLTILTNFYDNGKSTGAVRTVFNGDIGGPSDIRKNQLLNYKLINKKDKNSEYNGLLTFLEERFDTEDGEKYVRNALEKTKGTFFPDKEIDKNTTNTFESAINTFFNNPNSKIIDYKDFNIGNIIYAGLAAQNNNSLREAARTMSKILSIPDNIILNSDESLFLIANLESGKILSDEGDIVDYNNEKDPIISIELLDKNGIKKIPVLCDEAKKAIKEADLIIFSSGTLWSSAIPTYVSEGFREAIDNTKAKKYFVMNKVPDKDMIGIDSDEIQNILNNYIDMSKVITVFEKGSSSNMSKKNKLFPYFEYERFIKNNAMTNEIENQNISFKVHNGINLSYFIIKNYFEKALDANNLIFDWDDTIKGRKNTFPNIYKENLKIINKLEKNNNVNIIIMSGNDIHEINFNGFVYSDGANNLYNNKKHIDSNKDSCLNDNDINFIKNELKNCNIDLSKIKNRNYGVFSIKPLENNLRIILVKYLNLALPKNLIAKITGKSTVDIMTKSSDKLYAFKHFLENHYKSGLITYLGDEYKNGNDKLIYDNFKNENNDKCSFVEIDSLKDTLLFLKLYENNEKFKFKNNEYIKR